jgi:DNA-binding XRE family transcriptional regulator
VPQRRTDRQRAGDREAERIAVTLGVDWRDARRAGHLTQAQLGERVGLSRSRIGQLEAGRGGSAQLDTWVRLGMVLGRPFAARFTREMHGLIEPADAGHLAGQELILRLARHLGRHGSFELPTRPSTRDGLSVDVGVRDDVHRAMILIEIWNTTSDLGAASRSSSRKIAEVEGLASFRGYRVALCWLLIDTASNRALVRRYPEVIRARFPGSSIGWVRCLTLGQAPPAEAGIAWIDPRSQRLTPLRLRG